MHRIRHVARSFATSARSRPLAAPHYLDVFYRDSKAPIWRLLDTLKSPAGRLHLNAALAEAGVPLDEYTRWRPTLTQHDIQQAIAQAEDGTCMPPWVVLFLVLYKVRTADHASNALPALLHIHRPSVPETLHAPLLVVSAYQLARHNLVVPLQALTDTFLTSPIPTAAQETAFNLFLDALSRAPLRTAVLGALAVRILTAMDARQVALRPVTYRALLADRFVTLQLTKHLMTRMAREPYPPTAEHLEGFLRVFARDGAIHEARKYYTAIHAITTDPPPADGSHDPRYAANTLMLSAHEDKASAFAFLRRLAQLSSPSSKVSHLTSQHTSKSFKPPAIRFVARPSDNIYDQTAALHVAARDLRTPAYKLIQAFVRLPARPTVATHTVLIRGLLFRKAWARAAFFWSRLERECLDGTGVAPPVRHGPGELSSRANVPQTSTQTRPRKSAAGGSSEDLLSMPPAWARAPGRRMVMDNAALTAGLQALVRAGRPLDALSTLDFWAWRADLPDDASVGTLPLSSPFPTSRSPSPNSPQRSPSARSSSASPSMPAFARPPTPRAPPRIKLTTISYNELLVSFKRSARPDVVFLMWDLMPLYGVAPDANSLGVLLQAARMTVGMDDNVRGAVERARGAWRRAWRRLRMRQASPDTDAGSSTAGNAGATGGGNWLTHKHPGAGFDGVLCPTLPLLLNARAYLRACLVKPYVPGTQWRGRPPADAARAVFLQALFGMCEGLGEGHGVNLGVHHFAGGEKGYGENKEGVIVAPAAAVRDAWDAEARSVFRSPRPYVFTPPDGVLLRPPASPSAPLIPSPPSTNSGETTDLGPHAPPASLTSSGPPTSPRTFYPTLAPTSRTCLAYIALLSSTARAPEIPLFLAWMRRAGVQPSNSVLGMALVLWAEVGVQAPVVEMLQARAAKGGGRETSKERGGEKGAEKRGRGTREEGDVAIAGDMEGQSSPEPYNVDIETDPSEYARLVRFVRDWVGPRRVPGPRTLAKWRGIVLAMRRAGGGGGGL